LLLKDFLFLRKNIKNLLFQLLTKFRMRFFQKLSEPLFILETFKVLETLKVFYCYSDIIKTFFSGYVTFYYSVRNYIKTAARKRSGTREENLFYI